MALCNMAYSRKIGKHQSIGGGWLRPDGIPASASFPLGGPIKQSIFQSNSLCEEVVSYARKVLLFGMDFV
jgi:hypothetical protein